MPDDSARQPDEPTIDRRSADIGIVCTHHGEIKPLVKMLDRMRKYSDDGMIFRGGFIDEVIRIAIVEAGSGFAQHRSATQTLIDEHNPPWILSVGFSSALTPDLQPSDICLANEICDQHGNSLPIKCNIPESKRIFVRKHIVADQHPSTPAEKQTLSSSSEALACDTTSLAVAQACNEAYTDDRSIRFLSIRGIIDTHNEIVNAEAIEYLFAPQKSTKPNLISGLKQKLKRNPSLIPWQQRASDVAPNLNRFVVGIVRQIADQLGKSR